MEASQIILLLDCSIGKGVLNKTIDVKVQAQKCLNFDVNRFVKYSFSYGTSQIRWMTIG